MARHPSRGNPFLSVIVAVYDEVDSVEPLHRELMGVLESLGRTFEVFYVDDGSRDGSTEKLRTLAVGDARVHVVSFRRNFGQTAAIQAGIDHSRGDVLVFLDGDMQNDPHDIPQLLDKIGEGYDVVSGWRRDRGADMIHRLTSRVGNWLVARVTGVGLSDFGCTLKAYRREVIRHVRLYGETHRFMPAYADMVGARITEVPVHHRPRTYGRSKSSLSRTWRVTLDLITVKLLGGYSTRPQYFFGFAGLGLWALAVVFAGIVVLEKVFPPHVYVHQNPLVLVSILLVIVGGQVVLMGLLAAVSRRSAPESQAKPTYFVREIIGREPAAQPANGDMVKIG